MKEGHLLFIGNKSWPLIQTGIILIIGQKSPLLVANAS
jgi:hypothetical protein